MSESSASASRPPTPVTAVPDNVRPYRFHWDPASRIAGPESVTGTTSDGRGHDYFSAIPQLGNLNINASTTSLALGSVPTEWSSSRHGFNAISTVLNNPHKRQAPPKAHSALPSVPASELPRVRRKDFDPYLQSISSEWDRFEHLTQHPPEAGPSTPRTLPSLEGVPSVFLESAFNLADPATFASVTELNVNDTPDADPAALAHSLPLLEKFSHYADVVEMHLTHEISLRSSSFFAALSNLHHLQAESTQCLSQITRLRDMLKEVDDNVGKRGLEIIGLERRMKNVRRVEEGVTGVQSVVEMSSNARRLLSQGNWHDAFDIVDALESHWSNTENGAVESASAWNGPLPPTPEEEPAKSRFAQPSLSVPLSSLRAFSALPEHLRSLTMEIVVSLSTDFCSALQDDLTERAEGCSLQTNERLKSRIEPVLEGLVRTKGLREAVVSWRAKALSQIQGIVHKNLPLIEEDTFSGKNQLNENGASVGGQLRDMAQADFMRLLRLTYRQLLSAIEGLHTQGTQVGEVLQSVYALRRERNPDMLRSEFADILGSVTELSHVLIAKVIGTRSDLHTTLPLHDFWEFFNSTWSFVIDCEVLCRRMVVGLRGAVVGQGKTFLQLFHQSRLNQSAKLVEDELWNPKEVLPELQRTVNLIVDSAVKDAPELVFVATDTVTGPGEVASPTGSNAKTTASPMSTLTTAPPSKDVFPMPQKMLQIEGRSYFTVLATSEALALLLDYLKVIVNLGMLVTETMSRVIEFLKAFNSRTCQVVLGAGAMRSAGLKNITAKHLALASQSLSIMIALIPYVRETFRRHLSPKQAVMLVEFDKLKRDYQEHQNEIHAKLVAIMGDRLSAHVKSLKTVDWNVPRPGGGANAYMELLVKETVTLHKVLSRYLSDSVVQDVMTQVFAAINHRLSSEYTKLELPHAEAKERLLADARFLHEKLSTLHNVGGRTNMLETVISERTLPGQSPGIVPATRSDTLDASKTANRSSTNLRLKGLLSKGFERTLPTPTATSPRSSFFSRAAADVANEVAELHQNGETSTLRPLPSEDGRISQPSSSGFKQVEHSAKEALGSEAESESVPVPKHATEMAPLPPFAPAQTPSQPSKLASETPTHGSEDQEGISLSLPLDASIDVGHDAGFPHRAVELAGHPDTLSVADIPPAEPPDGGS